jgi:hypothetical protein
MGSAISCGCGFGLVPRDAKKEAWLVAFAADGTAGLSWAPQETDAGWVLDVRPATDGPPMLLQRITITGEVPQVRAAVGTPPAGRRTPTLPPRP